jgi:hypothetical protein
LDSGDLVLAVGLGDAQFGGAKTCSNLFEVLDLKTGKTACKSFPSLETGNGVHT